jgi:hypothetical protein
MTTLKNSVSPRSGKPINAKTLPALDVAPKLGMFVRDRVTGFTGTLNTIAEMISGNTQYAIQPACEDGSNAIPESQFMDHHTVEVIGLGVSASMTPPAQATIQLGWKVEDIITGVKGIATEKITFLNGCVYFHVQPKAAKKEEANAPKTTLFEHKRLKKIGDGVVDQLKVMVNNAATAVKPEPVIQAPAVRTRSPGGPMRSGRDFRRA